MNTLLTTKDGFWHHLTLVACYQLAQSIFYASNKGGIGGLHVMIAALAGCRKPLVATSWTFVNLVIPNGHTLPL